METLLKGIIIGFSVAAPVGPIGVLCIRRTLDRGMGAGLLTGMGAAAADAIYGLIAALGLTAISNFLIDWQKPVQLVGILFLFYLGIKNFLKQNKSSESMKAPPTGSDWLSTLFLTLTNPLTILFFTAIFAGLGAGEAKQNTAALMVAGVFGGSFLWWFFLSSLTGIFRKKITPAHLIKINRLSGIVLTAFGLWLLIKWIQII